MGAGNGAANGVENFAAGIRLAEVTGAASRQRLLARFRIVVGRDENDGCRRTTSRATSAAANGWAECCGITTARRPEQCGRTPTMASSHDGYCAPDGHFTQNRQ